MAENETPTVVDRPGSEQRPAGSGSTGNLSPAALASASLASGIGSSRPGTKAASLTSTMSEQALRAVEAQRMRGLMTGIAASSAFTTLLPLLLGGDPFAAKIHSLALAAAAVQSLAIALWFRDPKRYRPQIALYAILSQIIVLVSGFYFWGVFSAYGALVPLTIYIAVGSATRNETILGISLCVVGQTRFSLLVVLGYLAPRGLVEPVLGRSEVA